MDQLGFDDLKLFARVAALGTLSALARERDAPVSQVSRALTRIEKACGARLIHRSTHGLALTAEGETFLDYCRRLTGTLEELEGELATQAGAASGRALRLPADGYWRTNDTGLAANMVLQGLGIGRLSTVAAGPLVRQGRLLPVLPEFVDTQPVPIHAVYAGARQRLPKIRACVDYWAEWIGGGDAG